MDRFWSKVEIGTEDECWDWRAGMGSSGYGTFNFEGRAQNAHRVAYILVNGPPPGDLVIDHLCRNRQCVNPAHLEAVTRAENVRRGESGAHFGRRTHCSRGHEYTPEVQSRQYEAIPDGAG